MAETSSFDLDGTQTKFRDLTPHLDKDKEKPEHDQTMEKEDHQDDQKNNPTAEEDQKPSNEALESQTTCLVVKKKQLFEQLEAMIMRGTAANSEKNGGEVAEEEVKRKPSRRMEKRMRKKVIVSQIGETHCGEGAKKVYSREVMDVLRFVKMEEQRKMWKQVLTGLDPVVRKEYDGLASSKHHKKTGKKEEVPSTISKYLGLGFFFCSI